MQRRILLPIILVLVIAAGAYYGVHALNNTKVSQLKASGTIESTVVSVSPELAGKVAQVLVDEGQAVKKGDPLLVLDDSVLQAQRSVGVSQLDAAKASVQTAQNALDTAKSQYQITLETALAQGKKTRLQDWFSDPNLFAQPGWYYTQKEQIQAMQNQTDLAKKALDAAQANLVSVSQSLDQAKFMQAEQRLLDTRLAYLVANNVNYHAQTSASKDTPKGFYNLTHCGTNAGYFVTNAHITNTIYKCIGDDQLGKSGSDLYNNARDELAHAQDDYAALLSSNEAKKVLQARADVSVAQERYYATLDMLRNLQTGDQSTEVIAAQGVVDEAQAQVDQAQKAVEQAQSNLRLIDTQLAKIKVVVPMDGVILTRNVDPGEYIQAGGAAFSIADLNNITITVYIPEDRYGQISMGQKAAVQVDSFPGQAFNAEVIHIADQAEFTPRNVQTVEGRSSTVYAIKLKVTDPEGKLKLGMPADVTFRPSGENAG